MITNIMGGPPRAAAALGGPLAKHGEAVLGGRLGSRRLELVASSSSSIVRIGEIRTLGV